MFLGRRRRKKTLFRVWSIKSVPPFRVSEESFLRLKRTLGRIKTKEIEVRGSGKRSTRALNTALNDAQGNTTFYVEVILIDRFIAVLIS